MRAVRVTDLIGPEGGSLIEVPTPRPGPGEVLLQVEAAPVNFVDLVTIRGEYQFRPALPYTPGKAPAGTVLAVGDGVEGVEPGTRVLAMAEYGGYAEQALAPGDQLYRLPDGVASTTAATLGVAWDTAWMALHDRARLQPGERVLVTGASGAVGQAAIELAQASGAGTVLATASASGREPPGVDPGDVVYLDDEPVRDRLRDQVRDRLDGEPVDVVIDTLGGDAFDGAIRCLGWRGRLVTIGYASGRIPTLKVNYLLLKNIEVSGLQISDYRRRRPDLVHRAFEEILGLVAADQVRTPEVESFPLEEWQTAMRQVEARATRRRVVLVP